MAKLGAVRKTDTGIAETWRFWFSPVGYAFFTIDEGIGTFSIVSDWGNYSHTWQPRHLGTPSLKDFVANGDCDYLARKFGYDKPRSFVHEFDEQATASAIRSRVLEERRAKRVSAEDAREIIDALDDGWPQDESSFFHNCPQEVYGLYGGDMCEVGCYRASADFRFLVDQLLPFFVSQLRAAGFGRRQQEAAHG